MVKISSQYGTLSRGRHCAKHVASGTWAERDSKGHLILDLPGKWMLHCSDGFRRKDTMYVVIGEDGELTEALGSRSRFRKV